LSADTIAKSDSYGAFGFGLPDNVFVNFLDNLAGR
jgi:hypothetical protein